MHFHCETHVCSCLHSVFLPRYLQIMGFEESEAWPMKCYGMFFCTTRSPSPASPPRGPHVPQYYCSPLGSDLLPGDPGAGLRCPDRPCTPHGQPCLDAAANGTQKSFPPPCSTDKSEAGAGSRDLEEETGSRKKRRRGHSPGTGASKDWQTLLSCESAGQFPASERAGFIAE